MRESCGVCSNYSERTKQAKLIKDLARAQGYQLYYKAWMSQERKPVDMEAQ